MLACAVKAYNIFGTFQDRAFVLLNEKQQFVTNIIVNLLERNWKNYYVSNFGRQPDEFMILFYLKKKGTAREDNCYIETL